MESDLDKAIIPLVMLREVPLGFKGQCYGNSPILLSLPYGQFEWVATDVDVGRLKRKAKVDCKSYSDHYLSDYHVCLLAYGALLPLGPLFPDAKPKMQRCRKCKEMRDIREFQIRHEPKDWDGQQRVSTRTKCRSCHSRYIGAKTAKNQRKAKRQAVKRTLKKHRGFSDTYIAELTEAEGHKVGSKLVKQIRQEMEDSGELSKAQYYTSRDGRVYARE